MVGLSTDQGEYAAVLILAGRYGTVPVPYVVRYVTGTKSIVVSAVDLSLFRWIRYGRVPTYGTDQQTLTNRKISKRFNH